MTKHNIENTMKTENNIKPAKRLTNLQIRRQREKNRRDARVRKIKKYQPLCISRGFIAYAYQMQWDAETTDAAAWIIHYWFIKRKKFNDDGWVPISYKAFKGMFGQDYVKMVRYLIKVGFLEYDEKRGSQKGGDCRHYRICQELRNEEITASYRLQTKVIQEQYIEYKKYWACESETKRKERAAAVIEVAFAIPTPNSKETTESYYYLVEEGYLTRGQFETIERLAENAYKVRVQIDDTEFLALAKRQYDKKKPSEKVKYDFDAYVQRLQGTIDRTSRQKIKIDEYGRFHVPTTNLMRGLWDFVSFKKQSLAAVDVKTSHVVCILALLKDIAINYFGGTGLHDERLARCQFSRQIAMIPGLVEHLRRISGIYQACGYFEYKKPIPEDIVEKRKMMHTLFVQFTKRHVKDIQEVIRFCPQKNNANHQINLTNFLHKIYYKNSNSRMQNYYMNQSSHGVSIFHNNTCKSSVNNDTNNSFSSPLLSPHPIPVLPPVDVVYEAVGVQTHDMLCQRVTRNLHACRFVLKNENDLDKSSTDDLTFRSLFFPSNEEIEAFEAMLQVDFYTLLMETIGLKVTKERRDAFKGSFFLFLYRRALSRHNGRRIVERENGWGYEGIKDPVRMAMETYLPSIVHFLDICKCKPGTLDRKGKDYKKISRAIQSIESMILCECVANLWKKYPKMFLITLHDAIKCLPKDVEKVKAELERTFKKYHVSPKFEVNEHKRPSDPNG